MTTPIRKYGPFTPPPSLDLRLTRAQTGPIRRLSAPRGVAIAGWRPVSGHTAKYDSDSTIAPISDQCPKCRAVPKRMNQRKFCRRDYGTIVRQSQRTLITTHCSHSSAGDRARIGGRLGQVPHRSHDHFQARGGRAHPTWRALALGAQP